MILWTDDGLFDTKSGFKYYYEYQRDLDRYKVMVADLPGNTRVLYVESSEGAAERHLKVLYDELQGEDRIVELRRP